MRHDFHVSEDEYLEGEEESAIRHEYLNGVVYGMAGGTRAHATIAGNVFGRLFIALSGKKCRPYSEAMRLRLQRGDDLRFYYPDAMVVCTRSASEVWEDAPSVVVEVLSESTERTDLGEKRDAYFAIPSLEVYLAVDSRRMEVTIYRRAGDTWKTEFARLGTDILDLPGIGCALTLAEIYEGAL